MAKVSLRASGGLNQDIDPNNLPEGDYLTANNIIFDAGKDGGAGAIRMLDSIKTTGLTAISGTIVDTAQDTDGSIYVLAFVTTVASIYKIGVNSSTGALENPILVLSYTHGATNGLIPDLRIIGDSLVWNYAGNGTLLSFWLKRTFGGTVTLDDLTLQKATPNNVATIVKTVTLNAGVEFLESTDFQFAYRYQYDNYEYSALSNYTQIYKGEKDTVKYTFTYSYASKPTYAKYLEVYVRIGNNGTWRRIDSNITTSTGTDLIFEWTGQIFESLDIITTGKPFDAVPVWAKNIEIAKNRIFLANIQDDYDSVGSITLSEPTAGYTLPAGSILKSYLGDSAAVSSSETGASGYIKPFANNSTYAIGVAYYDKAMKTRGVEKYKKFTTGKFGGTIPFVPNITATLTSIPSWVKYAQMVYTKNISKSYIFEGYASSIFFELKKTTVDEKTKEVTTLMSFVQSVTKDDLKEINAFVIDMMGMIRAGRIYTWQQGDYVSIKTPNGVLELKIIGQNDNLIYCAYSGDVMTNTTTVDPSALAFEIYTPKQQQEDESLVFYEYGNLVPVSGSATITFSGDGTLNSTTTSKLLGDMVFSTIDMPTYVTSPFTTDVSKGSPVVEDVITTVNSTHNFSDLTQSYPTTTPIKTESPIFTSISSSYSDVILDSSNVASSTGTSFKTTGYYVIGEQDAGVNKMTVAYSLQATRSLSLNTPVGNQTEGLFWYGLMMQVWKVPYNNTTNKYDLPSEKFGDAVNILTGTYVRDTMSGDVESYTGTHTIELNKLKADINPNDRFEVKLTLNAEFQGAINTASVTLNKKSGSTNSIVVTLNGDRTPVKSITSYNYNAEVSATKTKYLFRSISNAITNPYWNTSSGKPLLSAQNIVTTPRTNTIRYGGNYVQGTKINNISSFFSLDSNDVAIENGEITGLQRASRLQGNGSMMIVLCKRESAYIMLGEQELSQGNNASIRSLTANMIGTIRNFGNNLGMIDKRSVMNYKGTIWWWDDFNKKVVKYTPDGLELPSDTYMRSAFRSKSGIATFSYDPFHNMCFIAVGNETQSLGYSDNLKRWIAAYDFVPNYAESYGDRMLLFKSGILYRSLESGTKNDYNAFLGNAASNGNIKFVVNSQLPVMPLNVAVLHDMNVIDYNQSNGIKSSLLTIDITNDNGQASAINETNWLLEDNRIYAHVMRDSNSTGGIIEGNYIVGYLNNFLLTLKDKTQNMRVNSIDIEISPITGHS